ncbi:hypothetical protein VPNG_04882 [Cytospora leucostoma]|uniref:F-box domain-containing protein n=1 Tax=Cytospora leucostoma TaxID=1230097 RepID=A0A423XB75_9PEZI|nr:hypothetical protein VPNG_04882 [Cytospora leucostoma]
MAVITDLPCETVASILRNLDNVRDFLPTLLACRHFYSASKEHPGIEFSIFERQVPPALLPYSLAVQAASALPYPRSDDAVVELLDQLHGDPAEVTARLRLVRRGILTLMGRTHDRIQSFVAEFANDAWNRLSQGVLEGTHVLSSSEHYRFCRAFYRLELFYKLFRDNQENPQSLYFSRFSPWENEQIYCVHDYLEGRLAEASFDVLAHDVEFGNNEIDYLEPGLKNDWRQLWMSQGVDFVYGLLYASSYGMRRDLLASAFTARRANFPGAMGLSFRTGRRVRPNELGEYPAEYVDLMFSKCDHHDTDKGPYEAWRSVNAFVTGPRMFSRSANATLREHAYVLWDWDRVDKDHLLRLFATLPMDPPHLSEEDYNNMITSFHERSVIWQRGGRGYWSENDLSKVVWPGESE